MKKFIPILAILALFSCKKTGENDFVTVDDSVITAYLDGDFASIRESWTVQTKTPYSAPPENAAARSAVQHTRELVQSVASGFHPANGKALDKLFPGWRKDGIKIFLIVGCPVRYDAFTADSPEGESVLVLNLPALVNYGVDDETLQGSLEELFSHEFIHIIMKNRGYGESRSTDYLSTLDQIAYNEGFAHLLSYRSESMKHIEWKAERAESFENCRTMLKDALLEEDPEQQSIYIRKADTGYYYDRFAAVSSMLYLSRIYDRKGIKGLKRELERGPKNICKRIVRSRD
ncbi:MAG: hypothetical protein MJY89_04275 [Bacteroidales bacterium]|nr:hypothetical protein [Bacteroidales bacterium]